jgi:beta-N-acetylhexosaminidase
MSLDAAFESLGAAQLAGQLLVVGFAGHDLPAPLARALERGERAGVVIFRRNVASGEDGLRRLQALCAEVAERCPPALPPLLGIDEEGGRVARLHSPALVMPPMRRLAAMGGAPLVRRVASTVGRELRCLGLSLVFAPVVDVDTNPDNPVIGDRSFSDDPARVVELARAYLAGLADAGLASCLKHFPGHGDTSQDSHLALPFVRHDLQRLRSVELRPFSELSALADSVMTAHVVYDALDPLLPATLSPTIVSELLRTELGFAGTVFSDDLDMRAIAAERSLGEAAVAAVAAGCDLLLACEDPEHQNQAHAALAARIDSDPAFRRRAVEAAERGLFLRRKFSPRAGSWQEMCELVREQIAPLQVELSG